jgi:glutamyl-tRNA reductase
VNHKTAPVEIRERLAFAEKAVPQHLGEICGLDGISEAVVLSTCNRVEIYGGSENPAAALDKLVDYLVSHFAVEPGEVEFYRHEAQAAAQHLFEVASGLDSMVLGETEIFGQVKQAYQAAHEAGATGPILNKLFQKVFGVGKKVRTQTSIQEGSTSIGNVAVELAEKIFGHLKDSEVMVLGAGEMSRLTAKALVSRGAKSVIVANRTHERALELAAEMNGRAVRFDDWLLVLKDVDVVISSTGAPHTVIHAKDIESVRRVRKYRPLFLIDIAVPRDIEHAVGEIEEVYLYDIDALEQLADEARARRSQQIAECEKIIEAELVKLL